MIVFHILAFLGQRLPAYGGQRLRILSGRSAIRNLDQAVLAKSALYQLCETGGVSVMFLSGPIGAGKTAVAKALLPLLPARFPTSRATYSGVSSATERTRFAG